MNHGITLSSAAFRTPNATKRMRRGFTLIELSIVLVIIGLVIGGVLIGRDMIKTGEIRKTIAQKDSHIAAINTFKLKYGQLPGDITNAQNFFGASCGDTTTDAATGCNGNGNGLVETPNYNPFSYLAENYKMWMHLSLSGLVAGNFSGRVTDDIPIMNSSSANVPKAGLSRTGWLGQLCGNASTTFDSSTQNGLCLTGVDDTTPFGLTNIDRVTAFTIDSKIDDGLPTSGKVYGDSGADCHGIDYFQNMPASTPEASFDCTLSFAW